jgi:hypothetical protein
MGKTAKGLEEEPKKWKGMLIFYLSEISLCATPGTA